MINQNLLNFEKDLKSLYLKTNDKNIENMFIKISQHNELDFIVFLKNNHNLINSLKNPSVYLSILALDDIKRHGVYQNSGNLVSYIVNHNYTVYVPVFLSFLNLINNSIFGFLLNPYVNLLSSMNVFNVNEKLNDLSISDDLEFIGNEYKNYLTSKKNNLYKNKTLTRKQKRIDLFKYLLKRFSEDVAAAQTYHKKNEVAADINSGLLMKPNELCKKIRATLNQDRIDIAEMIYKKHLQKVTVVDLGFPMVYDNIKNDIMIYSLIVSKQEIETVKEKKLNQINWQNVMNNSGSLNFASNQPLDIDYGVQSWYNNNVVIYSSLILVKLFNSLKD